MVDKIEGTIEAWEERLLGASKDDVGVSEKTPKDLDRSLELQMISIRMQKSLLDKLKYIASRNGIGYQPLMKQILTRFADAEMKQIMRELMREKELAAQIEEHGDDGSNGGAEVA